jgi:hypothetical protein
MDKKEEMERIAKPGDIIRTLEDIEWTDYENRDHYVPAGTEAEVIKVIPEIDSWEVRDVKKGSKEPVFLVERGEFTTIKREHESREEGEMTAREMLREVRDVLSGRSPMQYVVFRRVGRRWKRIDWGLGIPLRENYPVDALIFRHDRNTCTLEEAKREVERELKEAWFRELEEPEWY